jgi:hypothetical protein
VASFCCRIRSLAWANAASAVRYGSVSWHAVEVNIGGQEDLPQPSMRTTGAVVGRGCLLGVSDDRLVDPSRFPSLLRVGVVGSISAACVLFAPFNQDPGVGAPAAWQGCGR